MKKLILFAILFAFFSCNQGSGSDDFDINNITGGTSSGISKASRIKPPSWILGKWVSEDEESLTFTFKADNVIMEGSPYTLNFKEVFSMAKWYGFSQKSSSTEYTITAGEGYGMSTHYKFRKKGVNKMAWDALGMGQEYEQIFIRK